MSETTDRMKVLIDGFDARVAATPASAWDNQSPCEDWKAHNVVEHVANSFLGVGGALSGTTHPPVGADENPPDAWARAKDAFVPQLDTADLSVRHAQLEAGGAKVSCEQVSGAPLVRVFFEEAQWRFAFSAAKLQASGLRFVP